MEKKNDRRENRLAAAKSPYLRSAAHQPVDWYPWCDEAFERARREDKPILLDIGAVWCHWCHVIDRESYENEEIARIINDKFIPIKVDRDERPDIDSRYQAAVSAITGQGGWPLTAFLTPEGKVFYGGTYFPPEDRWGLPGMKTLLTRVYEFYKRNRDQAYEMSENLFREIVRYHTSEHRAGDLSPQIVDDIVGSIQRSFDLIHGGFGSAPKFPHPSAIELALDRYFYTGQKSLLTIVVRTLERMGKGGIYDQLGGGFHRYSVDEKWIVPHFEKMSYDNSQLLVNYLHAYQVTGEPFFRQIAEGIIGFVNSVLSDQEHGGFYASQDADFSLHDDGDYWTWTLEEARQVLDQQELQVMALYYDIGARGEMRENPAKNVLYVAREPGEIAKELDMPLDEVNQIIASSKRKMLEARSKRPTPYVDRTIYAGWNGMFISAYLEAYKALGIRTCRDFALKTLDLLLEVAYRDDGGVLHSFSEGEARIAGLLDDQAHVAQALLDAYEVAGERRYLDYAEKLVDYMLREFWDQEAGGFFDTARSHRILDGLNVPRKSFEDSPTPSGNPTAAIAMLRLYALTGKPFYLERAEATLRCFAASAARYGYFASTYALALDYYLNRLPVVVIVGKRSDGAAQEMAAAAWRTYRPGKIVRIVDPELADATLPSAIVKMIDQFAQRARAYVCSGQACAPPVESPAELVDTLRAFGVNL